MKTISLGNLPLLLFVGYEGENDARGFAFDYSSWTEEYGAGILQMLLQRQGDADPYPVVLSAGEDGTAIWTPSATDTAVRGSGEIQLIYTVDEVVAKTAVVRVLIDRSLGASGDPPEPYENWLDRLTELAGATQQNAADAAAAATEAERQADAAEENADLAIASARSAGQSEAASAESALAAEGFAVGEQNGEAVQPGSPYFENNSKFYSEQAQQAAAEGGWVHFYIDENGDLHYVKTPNVAFAFFLQDGNLYVRA